MRRTSGSWSRRAQGQLHTGQRRYVSPEARPLVRAFITAAQGGGLAQLELLLTGPAVTATGSTWSLQAVVDGINPVPRAVPG